MKTLVRLLVVCNPEFILCHPEFISGSPEIATFEILKQVQDDRLRDRLDFHAQLEFWGHHT